MPAVLALLVPLGPTAPHSPRTITAPWRCAAFRIRTAAAATSISATSTLWLLGLLCAAGFAGDVSLLASGAGFPQPETKNASARQARETNCFLKIEFAVIKSEVMSTKDFRSEYLRGLSGESGNPASRKALARSV